MKKIKFIVIYLMLSFFVSINMSLAYANSSISEKAGFGNFEPFYYTKLSVVELKNILINNTNGINIVDIRSKDEFQKAHLENSKLLKSEDLPKLFVNMSFDVAKPILIIGEDPVVNDFFAKMASFYGYEAYIFDEQLNNLNNSGLQLVSGSENIKTVNQVDAQTFINAARVGIDEITRSLADLSQNLDSYINNNIVNMEVVGNVIDSIINQINNLRENPVTGMFFPTDQSVGDVLSDIIRDDRGIRNDAYTEGVADALNLVGGDISRRDQRRMGRNSRFERRQIVGTANDLKGQGYNEAVIDVLGVAGQKPSRLNQRLMNRSSFYQLFQIVTSLNNANEASYNSAVAETLKLQGVDLSRRDIRRMDRNPIYQRRQVVGAANDLKGEGFNEGVSDTLRLMGIDLSRRDVRRMDRRNRNQIDIINDAANTIESKGYDHGYQAGYEDGYNKGLMTGLLNTGVSGFRLNRLERKQSRVRAENLNIRDDFIQRRIDKVSERAGARKLRRYTRQERRDEFRDYGIIKKGRTVIDLAANVPVVSSAALNLPPFLASSVASLLGGIPGAGGLLSLAGPVVRIGTGAVMFGVKTGIGILGDSEYRTQIQKDMRLARANRIDLRRENRENRVVGAVPFPRINPTDNLLERAFSETAKERRRERRLERARNEVQRTRLEQRFNKRDELSNLITGVDNVRDLIDKSSIVVGPAVNLGINVVSGIAGLALGTVFPVIGGPGASIVGGAASYLWNVALDTVGDDYATRARRDYRSDTRRENRQALRQARRDDRNQSQVERQFGVENIRPGVLPSLQFGPDTSLPSIQSILQAGPENVRPNRRASRQLGPSRNTIGNAIEIIRTALSPTSEERRQNREERRVNRPERQNTRQERILNLINSLRSAVNLEPLSKEESSLLMQALTNL